MLSVFLQGILGFLIMLGPLVIFHELGHYLFARLFNVKAEIFSIGFGKKIWSKQIGETEWRIAPIPLGGYVKLLGEDREAPLSAQDASRALHRQAAWKRFFIFFAGPLFNFIMAAFIFMAIMAIGEPQISNVIGRVVQDSPAARAGFMSGDRVLSVEGKKVTRYEELMNVLSDNPGKTIHFEVVHPGTDKPVAITADASSEEGYTLYGEATRVGEIEGMYPAARSTEVGISDPGSVAAKAGIQTGDSIREFDAKPVKSFEELESLYASAPAGSQIGLKVEKADHTTKQVTLTKKAQAMSTAWGLHSSELFIEKVVPDSPASKTGLKSGDRLVAVGGNVMRSFFDLKDQVQQSGEKDGKVALSWEHEGKILNADLVPTATASRNALLKKTTSFTVGIVPMLTMVEPEMTIERIWNPFVLLYKGTQRMIEFSWRNFISIEKIIVGDVSSATLGGPIMIGKMAGETLVRGLIPFLNMMAVLSIGLGVLNILPVPVLDGGHLLLLAIESIRGKPLTIRTMEIIQSIGLTAILMLMFLVMKNDIVRVLF